MSRFHTPRAVLEAPLEPAAAAAILDFSPPQQWDAARRICCLCDPYAIPYANEFAIRWFNTRPTSRLSVGAGAVLLLSAATCCRFPISSGACGSVFL